jgi:hypothetical protein
MAEGTGSRLVNRGRHGTEDVLRLAAPSRSLTAGDRADGRIRASDPAPMDQYHSPLRGTTWRGSVAAVHRMTRCF